MITIENYFKEAGKINFDELPEALQKGNNLMKGVSVNDWLAYKTNDNIKRVVDTYLDKLETYLKKNPPPKATSTKPVKKSAPAKKESPQKKQAANQGKGKKTKAKSGKEAKTSQKQQKKTTNEKQPEGVEKILPEIAFIKRYVGLHGKVKTQEEILRFINSLQKAILDKRIRKTSPYAKEIEKIQTQLILCYDKMGSTIEITLDKKTLDTYTEIAESQKTLLSVSYIKQYISLHGKTGVKEKAQALMERIKKAVDSQKIRKNDPYADRLNKLYNSLNDYVNGSAKSPKISKGELNGLFYFIAKQQRKKKVRKHLHKIYEIERGLKGFEESPADVEAGEEIEKVIPLVKNIGVVSSTDLVKMNFKTIGLQGKYRELIGDPCVGFTIMVYGLPKSGKSTLCLDFAKHLVENHGKVLYCALEEKFGYTLKEKLDRLKAIHPNLYVSEDVPENLGEYAFVFIDSVTRGNLSIDNLRRLKNEYPKVSFVYIFHTTKNGIFRGKQEFAHDVDVIIEVADGKARANGRFGIETTVNCIL